MSAVAMTKVVRLKLPRADMTNSRPAPSTVSVDLVDSGGPANGPRYVSWPV